MSSRGSLKTMVFSSSGSPLGSVCRPLESVVVPSYWYRIGVCVSAFQTWMARRNSA
jgi:hypothetical protein